jgi:hypothetical protein
MLSRRNVFSIRDIFAFIDYCMILNAYGAKKTNVLLNKIYCSISTDSEVNNILFHKGLPLTEITSTLKPS